VGFKGECYGELAIGAGKVAWMTDGCGNTAARNRRLVAPALGRASPRVRAASRTTAVPAPATCTASGRAS
jgi:hypothetical protein